jgi:molecular chaperone HscB
MRRVIQSVNLSNNDFELLGLPKQFRLDVNDLQARWKDLQWQNHPDKFAAQGAAAQRVATQWSVRINEAYQRLKNPQKRAAYLCELAGEKINAETNTAMPADFLMLQMQWREELDEATSVEAFEAISANAQASAQTALQKCEQLIDQHKNFKAAVAQVRALMFIERFQADVHQRMDAVLPG